MAKTDAAGSATKVRRAIRDVAAVLLLAIAVTAAFRVALPDAVVANESTDLVTFYEPVAERLLDGDGLTTAEGEPALRYPPGYPVLLAAGYQLADLVDGSRTSAATTLSLVSVGIAAVLLWSIARRVFDRTVAWVAVVLWTLHPLHLWLSKQPNSELPYEVALYGSVLACTWAIRGRATLPAAACSGGLLAVATLVRPAGLLLVVPVAAIWWTCTRAEPVAARCRTTGLLLATFVLVLLPWTWWASSQAGHLVVGADATNVNVVEGLTLGTADDGELAAVAAPPGARSIARDVREQEERLQQSAPLRSYLWEQAQARPGDLALLLGTKAGRSWYGTDSGRWEPGIAALQAAFAVGALLGGMQAWRRGGTGRRYVALVSGLLLVTWTTTVAVDSIVRLMLPTLGLLVPLLAHLLVSMLRGPAADHPPERSSEPVRSDAASSDG